MPYVFDAGAADAPTIVFLHGGGLSGQMWQPQIERLGDFHCLVPDLPGHGHNEDAKTWTLEEAAQEVAALIRGCAQNGRAHVVGLSLGGAVGLTLLRVAPETIDHLLVSGSAAHIGRWLGGAALATAWLNRLLPADALLAASFRQFGIPEVYRALVADDLRRSLDPACTRQVIRALMGLELPRVAAVPTLVLVGMRETLPARQAARAIVARVSGVRGGVVRDVGHVWNLQAPDLFVATVRAWVADAPLPAQVVPLTVPHRG